MSNKPGDGAGRQRKSEEGNEQTLASSVEHRRKNAREMARRLERVKTGEGIETTKEFYEKLLEGMSEEERAGFVGYAAARFYHLQTREARPATPEYLLRVAKVFGYRLEWLIAGEGTPWASDQKPVAADVALVLRAPYAEAIVTAGINKRLPGLLTALDRTTVMALIRHCTTILSEQPAFQEATKRFAETGSSWGEPSAVPTVDALIDFLALPGAVLTREITEQQAAEFWTLAVAALGSLARAASDVEPRRGGSVAARLDGEAEEE